MLEGLRKSLGFGSIASEEALGELAQFCAALTEQFSDRLPSQFGRSLATIAAWWAIALYVQFPNVVRARRFREVDWQTASRMVADLIMARLFPDMPEDGPEKIDLRDALQGQILGVCKLWIAAFGFPPKLGMLQNTQRMTDQLIALFENEPLGLRDQFDLPADEDEDENGDDDPLVDLSRAFAVFFDICARSRR